MAEFAGPSFSLGLDLDLDIADLPTDAEEEELEEEERAQEQERHRSWNKAAIPSSGGVQDDDNQESLDPGFDPGPTRALKRLRRGPPPPPAGTPPPVAAGGGGEGSVSTGMFENVDDEIEEFSSPEEPPRSRDQCSSLPSQSTCGSSKFSLRCHGILTSQSTSKPKAPKSAPSSYTSSLTSFDTCSNKKVFQKLTISPLRKIQLLDSDSDDPSPRKDRNKEVQEIDGSPQKEIFSPTQTTSEQKKTMSTSKKLPKESLWNDLRSKQKANIQTPVLDEFCEEYFRSMKDPKVVDQRKGDMTFSGSRVVGSDDFVGNNGLCNNKRLTRTAEHNWDLPNPHPPVYRYFYHDDSRIQKLVRERLPYFIPLGAVTHNENKQSEMENLDYTCQFGPRDIPGQIRGACEGLEGSSKMRHRKGSRGNVKMVSNATGSWVNPRNAATVPKDAGKRRVRADGSQSGHWFTGQDGRKVIYADLGHSEQVYVTKNGQELSGQIAYRQYRKESGAGFKKSKKKAATRKKRKR